MKEREHCRKLSDNCCKGCEAHQEFLDAMREDAWEELGQPFGFPRRWFDRSYLWGSRANRVVEKCSALPDSPLDARPFVSTLRDKMSRSKQDDGSAA